MKTAMTSTALAPDFPVSSGEIQAIDFNRIDEVARKHALLTEYLRLNGLDGLLIQDSANFAWLTGGGRNTRRFGHETVAAMLVTNDSRVVLCNNVDSGQLFDRELTGLGMLLKERPWTENRQTLMADVCRGRTIGADFEFAETRNIADDLQSFRMKMADEEIDRLRELGLAVAHAVEATARNFAIGATEAEVAGHLAHRLIKHGIEPVRIQVMADGQGWRYRHWSYGDDRIERHVVIAAVGKSSGLHACASRTVCLGAPSGELQQVHHLATLIQATGIFFTRAGNTMEETWSRVARIYEKFGVPDEWRSADQAELTGYRIVEQPFLPESQQRFEQGNVICWHPSVRSSLVADTFLLTQTEVENFTPTENWPVLTVVVKGTKVDRPGILVRA